MGYFFQSSEKIIPDSFFSLNNPIIFSLIVVVVSLAVTYIFYLYVIIPMRKKHFEQEKNLLLSHAEMMALFAELDPAPIFRFDLNGEIKLANRAGNSLIAKRNVIGEKIYNLFPELENKNLSKLINEGEIIEFTKEIDGKTFQINVIGIIKYRIGQIYSRDITMLKKFQNELEDALKKSENSEKLKSHFLLSLSHEIRTPMVGLLGFNTILREMYEDHLPDDMKGTFDHIENSSKRLLRTIDLNINMAKVLTKEIKIRTEEININLEIKRIISDYERLVKGKNLVLSFEENTNGVPLFTDQYCFVMVISNLIDNAVKFTESGKILIKAYANDKNKICVDVSDTGIGISKEFQNKIFSTSYNQEVGGYSRPFEGNGLGLVLTKSFLDLNNSTISVNSLKGKGSTFSIIFNNKN